MKKYLLGLLLGLPALVFSASTTTPINNIGYTQIQGPAGNGYTITAYLAAQCAFATTQPSLSTVGHRLAASETLSVDSMGAGIYLWCKTEPSVVGSNYITATPATDAAINGNGTAGGAATSVNLTKIGGAAYTLGQAAMSASAPVVIASNQSAVPVSGTFWQATQPVSASSLPLPTGAATAVKQPSLGSAGTAASDVLTVQGISGMTALKVDGSAVTQPVSGTVTATISGSVSATQSGTWTVQPGNTPNTVAWKVDGSAVTQPVSGTFWQATQPISAASLPLPSGAATAAKQPALGTAGTASSDVITVQGITSMTALKVDGSAVTQPVSGTFWQATQPVSGTVTANAGTNLNTSALALESGGNLAAIVTNTNKIPSLGIAAVASSVPVVIAPAGTSTDSSGTITSGGTAQTAATSNTSRRKFEIQNIDTTAELLCFSVTGTASLTAAGSMCLSPATSTTGGGYYSGEFTGAISVIATTTGHKFTLWTY